jgi:hypothetical protein
VNPGTIISFIPMLLGFIAVQPGAMEQSVTRLVVQDEVILRVPLQPRPMGPPLQWVERNGPRCIPIRPIRRAMLSGRDRVDFVLANRARVRAQIEEDCPALDFYGGLYLQPQDNRLCAGRDAVHSRMGGSCEIAAFKLLVPKIKRQLP